MPYTAKWLRDYLFTWGDNVKHGYHKGHIPADPDTPRLAVHFGPRMPSSAEHIDICRAFASLHPATAGLANAGQMAWYVHTPSVSRPQQVLWLYYVEGWGLRKFREDWKAMSPQARSDLLELDQNRPGVHVVPEDGRGDELIAARLRISRRTVYYDRNDAITRMVDFLNPTRPAESAA